MSSTNEKLTKLYISLDSLLDTRLGALTVLDTDFAHQVATHPSYYLREEDVFAGAKGKLSKETFAKLAQSQRQEILANSLRTRMMEFVAQLMEKLFFQTLHTPFHSKVAIDVNTWPYVLSDDEAAVMVESIATLLAGRYTVNLITVAPAQLTVEHVAATYRAMIMYSYHEWLNLHDADVQKKKLRENTGLFVPRLWTGFVPNEEQLKPYAENNTDPFSFLQKILVPFVMVQFLPIALYCAALPENLPHYAHQ